MLPPFPAGAEVRAHLSLPAAWPLIPAKDTGDEKRPIRRWRGVTEPVYDAVRAELWAIPTGAVTGVVVLDFDGTGGEAARTRFGLSPHVRTGSGGAHVYVSHPGWPVKTVAGVLPGVDIRGDGGIAYVAGQSRKGMYSVVTPLIAPVPWSELPKAAQKLVQRRVEREAAPLATCPGVGWRNLRAVRYLNDQVDAVVHAPQGRWNATFHRAVYAVAGLVAAGQLDELYARETLESIGLDAESMIVLESSWEAGVAAPWKAE